ncbi:hypothetical protein F511_05083 [Dorcoceras hygrometricum]|uniref:Uncharacterized protein n=1 Tax=Dorcoceras hygrometricum TaxID=472368 RepID=A0A2Z7D504_9LAMI|nr:hypothetical protein F511_05083 [Dorcoceras hygrometricum]
MAGSLPSGPHPGPEGPNRTDLGSNRWLTRENWSLQLDAPAMLHRHDHLLVLEFVLPAPATTSKALMYGSPPGPDSSNVTDRTSNHGPLDPATMAGSLPSGPHPGPEGPNRTDLGSNRWLTRENWSLQLDAPAMLHRHDHLLVLEFVLPAPATTSKALMYGSPPGPDSSNVTDRTSNHGPTREKEPLQVDAPALRRDAPHTTSTT